MISRVMTMLLVLCSAALAMVETPRAGAEVTLPSIMASGMVLQRNSEAAVWGWDTPGIDVTVSFRGKSVPAVVDASGKFMVKIPTGDAGGPFEMTISGSGQQKLTDVLVGEVWIAGGQSNMWWKVNVSADKEQEIAAAQFPEIRVWDANTEGRASGWKASERQKTVQAQWKPATPENAGNFAATAYFFARELHQKLKVPVGIVHVAVPGTSIEPWLSPEYAKAHLATHLENQELRKRLYPEEKKAYDAALAAWQEKEAAAKQEGPDAVKKLPPKPAAPRDPGATGISSLFNGMVAPAAPFTARGFIWWQGESNASRTVEYAGLFPGLIEDWRREFGLPDAPFLYVELANFWDRQTRPVEDDQWPALRDAQTAALALTNVFRACVIDIIPPDGNGRDIHPPRKQIAGHRLALIALANTYGLKDLVWSGPEPETVSFDGARAVVKFTHVGGGLQARGGEEIKGFALAGADGKWHWAAAKLEGQTVTLTAPEVPQPVAVRYAWANNPVANLENKEGLPACPFRTDRWNLLVKTPEKAAK